jgi:hypothetical protein
MLIGAAVKEAAPRGLSLAPIFSLYSPHGPVFRVMLRATRTADWPARCYGFLGHCFVHGEVYRVAWKDLGAASCRWGGAGRPCCRGIHRGREGGSGWPGVQPQACAARRHRNGRGTELAAATMRWAPARQLACLKWMGQQVSPL